MAEAINTTNTKVSDLTNSLTDIKTAVKDALTKDEASNLYLGKDNTAKSANQVVGTLTINGYTYNGSQNVTVIIDGGGSGGGSSTYQYASKDDYGIVKIGEGIDVDEGVISCKTQLSPASKTSIGGVIIGDGISIDTDGKISSLDYATTEITNDNGPFYSVTNYGEYFTCQLNSSPTLYGSIDWLTCGNIVKFVNVDALNINLPFYICTPDYECEHDLDSGYRYVRTPTKFGTNKLHKMTLADMRQLVGKTFYLINANTSGAIAVYYGVEMIENKTDNINYLSCKTSPTDNDYNSIGIPANGGIVKIECCRGAYKSSDELTYECIYWKWEGGIQNSLTEFKDNVTE